MLSQIVKNIYLENLDKTVVRPEFKVAVYTRYALPSLRYHLTVHTLHQGQLEELHMVAQKFLKKWLGIPARDCTSAGIFSPALLAVRPVSQVYLEGHLGEIQPGRRHRHLGSASPP